MLYVYYYIVLLFALKCRCTKMLVAAMCGADHLKLVVHSFEVTTCFIMYNLRRPNSTIGDESQSRI